MNWFEKVDQKIDCEKYADKDVDHQDLVTELMLSYEKDENEEDSENCLSKKTIHSNEVKNDNDQLKYHEDSNRKSKCFSLFSRGWHWLIQAIAHDYFIV